MEMLLEEETLNDLPVGAAIAGSDTVSSPERLAALHATGLTNGPPKKIFDQLARIAAHLMDAPTAMVSVVENTHQVFPGLAGGDGLPANRRTLLSHSFCKYAVASGEPLVVNDARMHPLLRENPAVAEFGVIAYLGIPLILSGKHAIGTLCVIDAQPRDWSESQIESLSTLAKVVLSAIERSKLAGPTILASAADPCGPEQADELLAWTVSNFLDLLDRYDTCIRQTVSDLSALHTEEALYSAVAEAKQIVIDAARIYAAHRGDGQDVDDTDAVGKLWRTLEAFLRADANRVEVSTQLQQESASLSDFERAVASAIDAEQALRLALRNYKLLHN